MTPGELLIDDGEIELNVGRPRVEVTVHNAGDRPIQVGSHYHFAETNAALDFDRAAARGFRLDIAAGTAVRFEPGQSRTVTLVALAGDRAVFGFRQQVMGRLDAPARKASTRAPAGKKPATKRPAAKTATSKPSTARTPAAKAPPAKTPTGVRTARRSTRKA